MPEEDPCLAKRNVLCRHGSTTVLGVPLETPTGLTRLGRTFVRLRNECLDEAASPRPRELSHPSEVNETNLCMSRHMM